MALRANSIYKELLLDYMEIQLASGIQLVSIERYINYFDDFIRLQNINEIIFSKEMISQWMKPRPNEGEITKYIRVNWSIGFLIYVKNRGYDVSIPRRCKHVSSKFQAYIYSEDEIKRYFYAIDQYYSIKDPFVALYLPVIFRVLYCCGTRIGETLNIKKNDVDLDKGVIYLNKTKNQRKRMIVVNDELLELLKKYSNKCLYLKNDDDYFFSHINRRKITEESIYHYHRMALEDAGIHYKGDGLGPRLHDWRHTFAVTSLSNFDKNGYDINNVLPILKQYLGHTNVSATEKYVKLTYQHFDEVLSKVDEITKVLVEANDENK